MLHHAKRWQATAILLCDAVSITPGYLTPERLDFIRRLGDFFEFEAMFAHDAARYIRDQSKNKPNVYAAWLKARDLSGDDENAIRRFWSVADRICKARRRFVLQADESECEAFFDAKLFVRTSNDIRRYYGAPIENIDDTPPLSEDE